ncbi:MAG: CHRD domain-containing protein [Candidatus Entotheonellia bacterium]
MKYRWIIVLVAALTVTGVIVVPSLAVAAETFKATLTGPKEVPVCSTTGSGTLQLTIPDDQSRIDFALTYDLDGSVVVAHIHLGKRTEAGGVSVFFCGGGGKDACPPSPATVNGTIVAADVLGPVNQGIAAGEFTEVLSAIRNRLTYANVHSDICPSGEVRGQIR